MTYWYEIVKTTAKQLTLKQLDVSYPTKYMSNTPGDICLPVLTKRRDGWLIDIDRGDDGMETAFYLSPRCPYWPGHRDWGLFTARIDKVMTLERFYDDEFKNVTEEKVREEKYKAVIIGDHYAPDLTLWEGEKEGWVNCD